MNVQFEKLHSITRPGLFHMILYLLSGVRVRLTLWYVVTMALMLLVFGNLLYISLARTLQPVTDYSLANTIQRLATAYRVADGTLHVNKYVLGNKYMLGEVDVVLLINMQGEIVQMFGPVSEDTLTPVKQFIAISSDTSAACNSLRLPVRTGTGDIVSREYNVCMTILLSHDRKVGTLVIGHPRDDQLVLQKLVGDLLLVGPVMLLVLAVGGYWLATRAMRPVRLITRTAQEIGKTDLSRRLHLTGRDELGELAATLDGMLNRLEEAFDLQRQFTVDASHELRTPLTIMNVAVNQALSQRRMPEDYPQALDVIEVHKQALHIIQAENDHMTRLVNDLLILARADTGQTTLGKEEVDVSEVILDVVERLAPLASAKGVELSLGELPELPIVGDPAYLTSMLTNLIDNALKYTSGVGTSVHIESGRGTADQNGWGWIQVVDNGPGIAPENLPHLFHRFYRINTVRSRASLEPLDEADAVHYEDSSGSGLGLAIVQWVAQAHGGEVRVQSTPGSGSTFEVWLPLAGSHNLPIPHRNNTVSQLPHL